MSDHRLNETLSFSRSHPVLNSIVPRPPSYNSHRDQHPAIYVLGHDGCQEHPLKHDDSFISIGHSLENDICIHDPLIGKTQIKAVQVNNSWYFLDCGARDGVLFEGLNTRQLIKKFATRTIMKCGKHWIFYNGFDSNSYISERDSSTRVLHRSILNFEHKNNRIIDDAMVRVSDTQTSRESHFAPILIGQHLCCDLKVTSKNKLDFLAIVYWNQSGIFLEDLSYGKAELLLDGHKVIGQHLITGKTPLSIDGQSFTVDIQGAWRAQCHSLEELYPKESSLSLTALDGSMSPVILKDGMKNIILGRESLSDILVTHSSISREHARINVRGKSILIEDLSSANGTFVNFDKVSRAAAHAGDIVEFGGVSFFLHYQV